MNELSDFVQISRYAGERFDLVQAGGGNSSVKLDNDKMLIKASGFLLSEVSKEKGFSIVDKKKVSNILTTKAIRSETNSRKRESTAANLINEAILDKKNRPSIETLLHSFLYKYTLHTHPVSVNMVVIQKQWKKILLSIFKNYNIALINYKTPGIELALELFNSLESFKKIPNIIFLQNHGLIVTSENKNEIQKITDNVLEKIEDYLDVDMGKYKLTNKITFLLNSVQKNLHISYLSDDNFLNYQLKTNRKLFFKKPFCPDSLVFCGVTAVEIKDLTDLFSIKSYLNIYRELPKVIIYNNYLFFSANSIKKAKEVEDVLKFHIMVLKDSKVNHINYLNDEELNYLNNWEAEKYRQKI